MNINSDLISKLENLAKLSLSESEKVKLSQDLEKILDMFNEIAEVDTEGEAPLIHMSDTFNQLREDRVGSHLKIDDFKTNSPLIVDNLFAVPKVIS